METEAQLYEAGRGFYTLKRGNRLRKGIKYGCRYNPKYEHFRKGIPKSMIETIKQGGDCVPLISGYKAKYISLQPCTTKRPVLAVENMKLGWGKNFTR